MTVREMIYRLKDFPRDAVVCVRGRNKRAHADATGLDLDTDYRRSVPTDDAPGVVGVVVRIVGEEG